MSLSNWSKNPSGQSSTFPSPSRCGLCTCATPSRSASCRGRKKVQVHVPRGQDIVPYRAPDTVQHVIAVGFQNHLHASGGDFGQELAHPRLTGGMKVHFRVLNQQQVFTAYGQGCDHYWKHLRQSEASMDGGVEVGGARGAKSQRHRTGTRDLLHSQGAAGKELLHARSDLAETGRGCVTNRQRIQNRQVSARVQHARGVLSGGTDNRRELGVFQRVVLAWSQTLGGQVGEPTQTVGQGSRPRWSSNPTGSKSRNASGCFSAESFACTRSTAIDISSRSPAKSHS